MGKVPDEGGCQAAIEYSDRWEVSEQRRWTPLHLMLVSCVLVSRAPLLLPLGTQQAVARALRQPRARHRVSRPAHLGLVAVSLPAQTTRSVLIRVFL